MYRSDGPAALRCVGETEFANGVAAMSASGLYGPARACAAIVAYADCHLGAKVEEVLHAHLAAAPTRLRGVRVHAHWDPEFDLGPKRKLPGALRLPEFREGFAKLAPLGLSCDVLVFQTQLLDLVDLAQAFPETAIILNHVGMPLGEGRFRGRLKEQFEVVRRGVLALAHCPNVWMKVGGLGMREMGLGLWNRQPAASSAEVAAAYRPYVELCLQAFGPSRCMFESNFPVDRPSAGYVVLWNAFKRLAAGYSGPEKRELFAGTARRAYRLTEQ
jgi:predicted TIM-barrel fold metal-dependent hydrolase